MSHEIANAVKRAVRRYCRTKDFEDLKIEILDIVEKYRHKRGSIYQNVGMAVVNHLRKICNLTNTEIEEIVKKINPEIWNAYKKWRDRWLGVYDIRI